MKWMNGWMNGYKCVDEQKYEIKKKSGWGRIMITNQRL
jgi:hypothetical protein